MTTTPISVTYAPIGVKLGLILDAYVPSSHRGIWHGTDTQGEYPH